MFRCTARPKPEKDPNKDEEHRVFDRIRQASDLMLLSVSEKLRHTSPSISSLLRNLHPYAPCNKVHVIMHIRAFPLLSFLLSLPFFLFAHTAAGEGLQHALALNGEPKYGPDFKHFEYAEPDAPKGGSIKLASIGTYDSFNPFILKGVSAAGIGVIYDTLSVKSDDEPFTEYGLVANKVQLADDRSFIIFHIDPDARFHDGHKIDAADAAFSFNVLVEKGNPLYRKYYADVAKAEVLDPQRVKFHFSNTNNPELPLILGQLPVLPEHFWKGKDFADSGLEEPLGSGPYKLKSFQAGKSVRYELVDNYWAKDKPVNKGRFNYKELSYDYYRDMTVSLQAFKAGEYDFRQEVNSKDWAVSYTGPAFDEGMVMQEEIPHENPAGMQAFAFNTRKSIFKDPKVRWALNHAFDFEWSNKNLFYGQYTRSESFFANSEMASRGLPSEEELKILNKYKGKIPEEVFTKEYKTPKTDGSGNLRNNLRTALKILKEAGWSVKEGKLTNTKSGEVMAFEMLLLQPEFERVVLPMKKNLERLGVDMSVRVVDASQYVNRISSFDFDMLVFSFPQSSSPGNEQRNYWSSEAAATEGSRNIVGIQDPVIDELVELIITAPDRKALITRCRALDRILLWGHYVIPNWYSSSYRVAYWKKFDRPAITPKYALGIFNWWVDPTKEKALMEYKRKAQ
jgi:microcin C transport system substrate-binding protein